MAEPGTPTPLASCNSAREAASPHACAVGEAISSPEHTGSHLAVRRVRVRAEITAQQTLPGAGTLPAPPHLAPQPLQDVCLLCLGTGTMAEPRLPRHGGHGLAVRPCPPHVAPGTVLSTQGLSTVGDTMGSGCHTSQETFRCSTPCRHVKTWNGDPGHCAGLPRGSLDILSSSQEDLLRLAPTQPVLGMALLLLRLSRSNGPYLLEPVSLLSGAFHPQIPF